MTGVQPGLEGVPETLQWTLWHRALEARRPTRSSTTRAHTALLSIWAVRFDPA